MTFLKLKTADDIPIILGKKDEEDIQVLQNDLHKLYKYLYLLTWIPGVASKQLRLVHGRVGDSTTVVNSLSPQMSDLVEDAIASMMR